MRNGKRPGAAAHAQVRDLIRRLERAGWATHRTLRPNIVWMTHANGGVAMIVVAGSEDNDDES